MGDNRSQWAGESTAQTTIGRRSFLRATAASAAAVAGASAGSGSALADHSEPVSNSTYPRVTTRGHYEISWWGGVRLTSGHTDTDYATAGSIPGWDSDQSPAEVVISAHGWQNDADEAPGHFADVSEALSANGYDQPVVGFSYDADTSVDKWYQATQIAERNGAKLAAFTVHYADRNPQTAIRYVSHSLGARVVLSAVETLNQWGYTDLVDSLVLLGGAADATSVGIGGGYGSDIRDAVGRADNFYKTDDQILQWLYGSAQGMKAVGEVGCWGTEPGNYTDHDVSYVEDHSAYNDLEGGCMHEVAATFR